MKPVLVLLVSRKVIFLNVVSALQLCLEKLASYGNGDFFKSLKIDDLSPHSSCEESGTCQPQQSSTTF